MQTGIDIIIDLKGENNQAFGTLYKKYFALVNRFITNNNGTNYDAEDIFQDTMIALVAKLRQDDFVLEASVKTYIMAIAKNLWFKKLRTANRETAFTEIHDNKFYEEITLSIEKEKNYSDKLQNYIHKITAHCKSLIHDMFFKNKSIEQIQKDYGYTTKHNAQNQKHKCVEQIRKVKEREERKEIYIFYFLMGDFFKELVLLSITKQFKKAKMKKAILAIAILIGLSTISNAQTSMKIKDGVMIKDGKAMLCKGKKCTPLTKTYTCTDGCKVSTDGTVTKPDGTTMKLIEGYEIGKDGKMAMIPHGQAGHVCTKDCPMVKKM